MRVIFTVIILFLSISQLNAWIYPEHRDIALLAIQKLSPEYRAVLDKLWSDARTGYELRLTEAVIDATQSVEPTQLDFASWPAISGDHSCSSDNLLYNVLQITPKTISNIRDIQPQHSRSIFGILRQRFIGENEYRIANNFYIF